MNINIRPLLLTVVLALSIGACSEQPQNPVRIGTNLWPGYEAAYLASDLGYYGDLQVQVSRFKSATQTIRAFRGGTIEIAALTLDEVMPLLQDGIDLKVFLVVDVSHGGDVIMARPGINDVKDLRGRKVGVERGSLGTYVLVRALEIHGVSPDQVETIHISIDDTERAYALGAMDALVTFEPYRSRLLRDGASEIFSSRDIPNEIVDVLIVRSEYAAANPEKIKTVSRAWLRAIDFITTKPREAAQHLGKHLDLTVAETQKSFDGLVLPDTALNVRLLTSGHVDSLEGKAEKLIDVMMGYGLLMSAPSMGGIFTDAYVR